MPSAKRPTAVKNKDHLNFKPGAEFKREYQMFAAAHGMSMLEMLKESLTCSNKRRSAESNPPIHPNPALVGLFFRQKKRLSRS